MVAKIHPRQLVKMLRGQSEYHKNRLMNHSRTRETMTVEATLAELYYGLADCVEGSIIDDTSTKESHKLELDK